jgi:hypothetical protein
MGEQAPAGVVWSGLKVSGLPGAVDEGDEREIIPAACNILQSVPLLPSILRCHGGSKIQAIARNASKLSF